MRRRIVKVILESCSEILFFPNMMNMMMTPNQNGNDNDDYNEQNDNYL